MEERFERFTLLVARLYKLVGEVKTRRMAQFGLRGIHALCLFQLLGSPEGRTPSELAEDGQIDRAQVSRVLTDLLEARMVRRDGEPGRYRVRFVLTELGRTTAGEIRALAADVQRSVDCGIDPDDLAVFYRVMQTLCTNFEKLARCP